MEHRGNHRFHYGEPYHHHYLHRNRNRRQRLYQNSLRYRNGIQGSECYRNCFSCSDLCRSKQYDYGSRRWYIRLEYRRNHRFHYGQPCCDHYLYRYGNQRSRLYQNGNGNGNGQSFADRNAEQPDHYLCDA